MAIKRMASALFVARLRDAYTRHDGYILGATGQNPRTGYHDLTVPESKCMADWLPNGKMFSQYKDKENHVCAMKWRRESTRVWDCNGLAEGIYQIHTGVCIDKKAKVNYARWCKPKGKGTIPPERRVPGAAVFFADKPNRPHTAAFINHVAFLYEPVDPAHPERDWYLIEAGGVKHGVGRTRLYNRKPGFWGHMAKYYDYSGASAPTVQYVTVTGKSVNVRNQPGINGTKVVGTVKRGAKLPYYGATRRVNGVDWYQVEYQYQVAWICGKYAQIAGK